MLSVFSASAQREFLVTGIILDEDSITPIPFAYAINDRTGNGCVSDFNGLFTLTGQASDTLRFSFLGYNKRELVVRNIKNASDSTKQFIKVFLKKTVYTLEAFSVNAFKIKPYEREYMQRVINKPKLQGINVVESPITAMYDAWSHKGRANRKLAAIFEQMFIEEQVEQKFNAEILRKLTGDETIDFAKFKKYCYSVTDDFILTHDGYDLYEPIMDCYKRWKKEGR